MSLSCAWWKKYFFTHFWSFRPCEPIHKHAFAGWNTQHPLFRSWLNCLFSKSRKRWTLLFPCPRPLFSTLTPSQRSGLRSLKEPQNFWGRLSSGENCIREVLRQRLNRVIRSRCRTGTPLSHFCLSLPFRKVSVQVNWITQLYSTLNVELLTVRRRSTVAMIQCNRPKKVLQRGSKLRTLRVFKWSLSVWSSNVR